MRYWSYFAAKLGAIGAVLFAVWAGMLRWIPETADARFYGERFHHPRFIHDLPWAFALIFFGLFGLGLLWLAVWDQRRRCRTCLRVLMMPVEKGSWAQILTFGPPSIEYICPYGHGTLQVPEAQISTSEPEHWRAHGDIWTELSASSRRT